VTEEKIDSNRITYLQMIQSSIDRMSTASAVFKGFCVTIITGISAISFTEINRWILLLAVLPVLCFLIIDVYYLQLERRYRVLYDDVRTKAHDVDFDLAPPKVGELNCPEVRVWSCIKSPSIYLFYLPAIIIVSIVITMKFTEVM